MITHRPALQYISGLKTIYPNVALQCNIFNAPHPICLGVVSDFTCFEIVSVEKIIAMCMVMCLCSLFSSSGFSSKTTITKEHSTQCACFLLCFRKRKTFVSNYFNYVSVQLRNTSLESTVVSMTGEWREEVQGQLSLAPLPITKSQE